MYEVLVDINKDFALLDITEILALDENGNYRTSYPECMIDIIYKERLDDNKIIIRYYYKQSVFNI